MKKLFNNKNFFIIILFFLIVESILIISNISFPLITAISFILIVLSLIFIFKDKINNFLNVPVITENLPITRVLYSLICIFTAVQHITLIPSSLEPMNFFYLNLPTPGFWAYALSYLYLAALISLLFGKFIRLSWIIIFVTGGLIIPFSLEIFFKNVINFYAIFIPPFMWRGEKKEGYKFSGWPILLMGLSFSFLITGAGLFKLFDPVWLDGVGLYYSLNIPYFTPKHLWPLLDNYYLMLIGNWATIIFEFFALPFYLFKKTRNIANVLILSLGLFLTYPMAGIGLVGGPVILSVAPLLLAITGISLSKIYLKFNFLKSLKISKKYFKFDEKFKISSYNKLGFIIFLLTINSFFYLILNNYNKLTYNPVQYGKFTSCCEWLDVPVSIEDRINTLKIVSGRFTPPELYSYVWLIPLFDYNILFDRIIFRIKIIESDENINYIDYFNGDGSMGDDYPLIFNERFILTCYKIMDNIQYNLSTNQKLIPFVENELTSLTKYSISLNNLDNKSKKVIIQIKTIDQPFKFEGNTKPWILEDWLDFYEYDFSIESGKLLNIPERFDFNKLEVPAFRENKLIKN